MIRWLALTAQGRSECLLRFEGEAGADVESMARCLDAMGVRVHRGADGWLVEPPADGLQAPMNFLDCGNSGTAARIASPKSDSPSQALAFASMTLAARVSSSVPDILIRLARSSNFGLNPGINIDIARGTRPG
jgi:5-enolpyruvylshikimate-3-phosphate synthase